MVSTTTVFVAPGQDILFDTTVATFGSSISRSGFSEFILLEGGFYRLDFILQVSGDPPFTSVLQFVMNGATQVAPVYTFEPDRPQHYTGSLLVEATPGDTISLRLTSSFVLLFASGNSLFITQLNESVP